jgi:hypothetical protein
MENLIQQFLQMKFPVIRRKLLVPRNNFPVNLLRELREKWLQHSGFFATKVALRAPKSQISL